VADGRVVSASTRLGRDFQLFRLGQGLNSFGSSMTALAIPLLIFRLTGSPTGLGVAFALGFLPYLIFGLVAGAITDRVDRRRLMIRCDATAMVLLVAVAVLSLTGHLQPWVLFAATFLITTIRIFLEAGTFSAVPALVESSKIETANGRLQAVQSAGRLAGPVTGAIIVTVLPIAVCFAIDAGTFAVSGILLACIRRSFDSERVKSTETDGVLRRLIVDVRAGVRYVWSEPVLRTIAMLMIFVNFFDAAVVSQLVLIASDVGSGPNGQIALVSAAGDAGILLTGAFAGRLSAALPFVVRTLGAEALCGVCVLALAMSHGIWQVGVLWSVYASSSVLFNIATNSRRQRIVPGHLLGRVMTTSAVLAYSAVPIGSVVGGQITGHVGIRPVLIVVGTSTIVLASLFVFSPLGIRKSERETQITSADGQVGIDMHEAS
jgi:MFS family permease